MTSDTKTLAKLASNFELLRNMIRHSKHPELKVDLNKMETIIHHELPEKLQQYAPADFHIMYTSFKAEYERFKDFILFDKLIGKNIISLGGGFSSGKSSFLNALMRKEILPSDIDPSTSVPTYIVNGPAHQVQGINVFDTKIDMELSSIRRISHGFGKVENENLETVTDVVTLGHILKSIFFSTPLHQYNNIAFLDTPGYSKPDNKNYTAKTDEQIARTQLNSSNFILWFVQADAGTITDEDISFMKTLRSDIPKLIILTKADKKPESELVAIIASMKQVLSLRGIQYVDVLSFSSKEPEQYDANEIMLQINRWNEQVYESNFARNFKTLFMNCKLFYDSEINLESRRLNRLNKARMITEDVEIAEYLDSLIREITKNIAELKRIHLTLKQLQHEFFSEIKMIADIVGIGLPEPSEIELIQDKVTDPLTVLMNYKQKMGIMTSGNTTELLQDIFSDITPVLSKLPGGSQYVQQLVDVIRTNGTVEPSNIRIHDFLNPNGDGTEDKISKFRSVAPTIHKIFITDGTTELDVVKKLYNMTILEFEDTVRELAVGQIALEFDLTKLIPAGRNVSEKVSNLVTQIVETVVHESYVPKMSKERDALFVALGFPPRKLTFDQLEKIYSDPRYGREWLYSTGELEYVRMLGGKGYNVHEHHMKFKKKRETEEH